MSAFKPARNALKGYTYQTYVLALFLAKMDTDRNIVTITSECLGTKQFDDLFIQLNDGLEYRIQVKNYPELTIDSIAINGDTASINGNKNKFNTNEKNILIINTNRIVATDSFMGLPATSKDGIIIVPLTSTAISDCLDDMFKTERRELRIIQMAIEKTASAYFEISFNDLPRIVKLSTDLNDKTSILRETPDEISNGVTYIVGKPGVGKSHYVNELTSRYPAAIVYRFWVNSQDGQLKERLRFEMFIREIGMLTFKSPKNFTEDELIDRLYDTDAILIVDGLDHVENYNYIDLNNFISFFSLLDKKGVKTILLSRPLQTDIPWDKSELLNWDINETAEYLYSCHNISDYEVQSTIFRVAQGYPILTYFLSEHYKKNGVVNINYELSDINEYYSELLNDIKTKAALCTFATNNSFFTYEEIKSFCSDPESYEIINGFISEYPYLFEILINRVSLIHDSLNTYLRKEISSFPEKERIVLNIVKESLRNFEIEYMSRMTCFRFDEDFYKEILIQYCSFESLNTLLKTTIDYNSIANLYKQLQVLLETRRNLFNVSQYYTFVLLFQAVTRNDLIGYEALVYQVLEYAKKFNALENQIFSSDFIWNIFLVLNNKEEYAKRYIRNMNYANEQFEKINESINDEYEYFDIWTKSINYQEIERLLAGDECLPVEKERILEKYLVFIFINDYKDSLYYKPFLYYLNDRNNKSIIEKIKVLGVNTAWATITADKARSTVKNLGLIDKDSFCNKTLIQTIHESAPKGSFATLEEALSYIRLSNHEQREIDIFSINYGWTMYYNRKDYSVYSIDDALLVFEKLGFIEELESTELINKLIQQSEKGIRDLLSSYINKKAVSFVKKLIKLGYFTNKGLNVDIFDLTPEKIDCFPEAFIIQRLKEITYYYRYSKTIEYCDIRNVIKSQHKDMVLYLISCLKYRIGSFDGDRQVYDDLVANNIDVSLRSEEYTEDEKYKPLKYGCIHENDFDYIIKNHMDMLEVAKYTDGWYSCLPYPEVFKIYNSNDVKNVILDILHNSLFAKSNNLDHIGNWSLLIGNIIVLLDYCNYDEDWEGVFFAFKEFLKTSLIAFPDQ